MFSTPTRRRVHPTQPLPPHACAGALRCAALAPGLRLVEPFCLLHKDGGADEAEEDEERDHDEDVRVHQVLVDVVARDDGRAERGRATLATEGKREPDGGHVSAWPDSSNVQAPLKKAHLAIGVPRRELREQNEVDGVLERAQVLGPPQEDGDFAANRWRAGAMHGNGCVRACK